MADAIRLEAADRVGLEAQVDGPRDGSTPRAGMVLCHPHPQYGGTMRSLVISALFEALPRVGVECLRFNFRGVEGSDGEYTGGDAERLDALAAVAELSVRLPAGVPLVLAGWSFGADVALSCTAESIAGWLLVACPLRFAREVGVVAGDARPKCVVLAQHDEFRAADEVAREVSDWRNTQTHVVGGASHFFVGRTDQVVAHASAFVGSLAGDPDPTADA
ncbi:MAG TPA: alpha/beta family hydrolase [Acidimicrobiia bacterium]